jgi:tetratricopeptide (TPR) repeat protein
MEGSLMDRAEQDRLFRRVIALLRRGSLTDAAVIFKRLVQLGSEEPLHVSYCGLTTAIVTGEHREGLAMCERAMRYGAYEPDLVLNSASVYATLGRRAKAIKTLRRGLKQYPRHKGLLRQINKLSPRRRPPLSFVHRDNFVNKGLAILLARMTGRYQTEVEVKPTVKGPATAQP